MDEGRTRSGPARPRRASPGEGGGQRPEPGRPTVYQIRVKGHLDDRWTRTCEGLAVAPEDTGNTLLTALVVDQAALYGLLRKLRDLGAPLVSINPVAPDLRESTSYEERTR